MKVYWKVWLAFVLQRNYHRQNIVIWVNLMRNLPALHKIKKFDKKKIKILLKAIALLWVGDSH